MKNLSEYRELSAPRVPRSGGHDPFRFRKRGTDHGQKMRAQKEWKRHAPEEYRAARLRKLMLGRLPGRAAKYGCADFDLSDTAEYAGDDGAAVTGGELAGIAAHIVLCAKHPVDYLFSLRNVPAKVIEPIKAYLRVKLAMGRLKAEIDAANLDLPDNSSLSSRACLPANTGPGTSQEQHGVERRVPLNATISSIDHGSYEVPGQARDDRCIVRDDRGMLRDESNINPLKPADDFPPLRSGGGGPELLGQKVRVGGGGVLPSLSEPQFQNSNAPIERSAPTSPACGGRKPQPSFKWHTSPAKTHNFKELTKTYGYDPRGTSVYWIEKRANSLRRKWKKHGQQMRGESEPHTPKTRPKASELVPENSEPKIKHFTPADIDYNSVWPPVKMPDGPPKAEKYITENGTALLQEHSGPDDIPADTVCTQRAQRQEGLDIPCTAFKCAAVEAGLELRHTASMSLLTRILTAGARLFGPPPGVDPHGRPGQIEPAGVTAALIALGAKMAKSNGVVTPEEIAAFKRVFQAAPQDEPMIGRFFDLARQTTAGFERYAAIIAKRYRAQPAALEDVLDGLFHIALADSVVSDDEMAFLRRVSEVFGFSELEFNRIKAAHVGRADDDPYLILGIDERVTDSELKRAYRRMAAANHPDRLMARGLPKELIGLANHKMSMINTAYEEIKRQRKSILPKLHGPGS